MKKQLVSVRKAPTSKGMGNHVRQVIPSAVRNLDPFVFLDHFNMEKAPNTGGIPPHPHAGIATITYLFEGSNRHRDSLGNDLIVRAGDLAWMQAGKGIIHSEGMQEIRTTPERVHGLQLWISLPAKDKFAKPDFFFYPSQNLTTLEYEGYTVKVLCGELAGAVSPVKSLSPAYIWEVKAKANQTVTLPITAGNTCGAYVITGEVAVEQQTLSPLMIAEWSREGTAIQLVSNTDSHFIVLGGTPLDEPIVGYASYVMNNETQILQVMRDYQMGKMGFLEY